MKLESGWITKTPLVAVRTLENNKSVENISRVPNKSGLTRRPYNSSHIVYIKVHKAASSTIQNILMRVGMKLNLTFALPEGKITTHQIGWPAKFSRAKHLKKYPKTPDVLCLHTVLSNDLIKTMPQDSFYFTSLRDPFTQVLSMFEYYNMQTCLLWKNNASFLDLIRSGSLKCKGLTIKCPQAFDLGLNIVSADDDTAIANLIQRIDEQFHFVIIVEYFNECLILLRDMLGWTTADILYFKSNFNGEAKKKSTNSTLPPEDNEQARASIYKYLKADLALYKHFKIKLEKVIALKRNYINAEIVKLNKLQNAWMADCVQDILPAKKILDRRFRPYGKGSRGYLLTETGLSNSSCISLAIAEIPHVIQLKDYQEKLLHASTVLKP
ncbi:hypothetical protein EB796_006072 [Bugula neritina]|uniref:GAL3ST1 n=1 Tax=Bugula neritina TaxID=10212 RepID=A0A7J7KAD9_BUGNE|nr:hypothetical protein EB796_006072 [Bugula neritina]